MGKNTHNKAGSFTFNLNACIKININNNTWP